ncbi:site-specific DNA-methyltransferase, partial [Ureaplasma miroungigenitalium]
MLKELKQQYIEKINSILDTVFNREQKKLAIKIINQIENESELLDVFKFVTQRVNVGFVFDVAPSIDSQAVSVLEYDAKRSFTNTIDNENTLIIGENYDALKNLVLI